MTLTELISIISSFTGFLAAIAAAVTLIFVYFQMKEMNKQSRALERSIQAATYQSIIDSEREIWDHLEQDKDFLAEWLEDTTSQSEGLQPTMVRSVVTLLAFQENLYYQNEIGALPKGMWMHWVKHWRTVARKPLITKTWPLVRERFYGPFSEFFDRLVQEEAQSHDS
jgi:hypothetical protein